MPPDRPPTGRRRLIAAAAGLAAATPAPAARALLPGGATLLVPGPENGAHERWSSRLAAFLARGGTPAAGVERKVLGGPDGVTAANRFAALVEPDGRTLLVLSGGAAQARLVGDPRVRFETVGWLPVCAAEGLAVVAGRADMAAAAPSASRGRRRFARRRRAVRPRHDGAARRAGLGLAPLQAEAALLEGAWTSCSCTARTCPPACRRWARGRGSRSTRRGARRRPAGRALHVGAGVRPDGAARRGAGRRRRGAAARGAGAARAHPADRVALWRAPPPAGRRRSAPAAAAGMRVLSGAEAAPLLSAALAPPPEAALAYRDWLLSRLNWRAA
jgi:hypothetical protein